MNTSQDIFFTIKPVLSEKNGREQRILINSGILWHLFALLLILIVLTFNDVFCGTVDILQRNGSNPQVQCTVSEGKTLMEGKDFCFRCTSCCAELFNCYVMPWRQDGLHLCFPPYKAVAPGSPFFFRRRQRNVFLKTSHFHAYKALAPASPFFLLKATKCPLKKMPDLDDHCHVFYEWPLGMRHFIKNWACDHFVGNTAPSMMAPEPMISLQTKATCYSPLF